MFNPKPCRGGTQSEGTDAVVHIQTKASDDTGYTCPSCSIFDYDNEHEGIFM